MRGLDAERETLRAQRDAAQEDFRQLNETNAVRLARRIRRGPN